MKEIIKIRGERVTLIPFDNRFITDAYVNWLRNEDVNRYLLKPNQEITIEEAGQYCRSLMESEVDHFFAIVCNEHKRHIGNVRIGPLKEEGRICQYSMMIGNTDYHGSGIGTEIVSLAINYCFNELNVHKLFLDVIAENLPAVRIYEKNGFITEGRLKDHVYLNGRYHDLQLMALFNPNHHTVDD